MLVAESKTQRFIQLSQETLFLAKQRSLVLLLRCVHEGVGGGGMLTFLVLCMLYVRDLWCCWYAVYKKGWGGGACWRSLYFVAHILEQLMPHGVLSKTSSPIHCVQRAKIFSCMRHAGNDDMWIYILGPSKRPFQRWSVCFEERICQIGPIKSFQNPHETRILPNSRARIWPNFPHKCAFPCSENLKNVVFTSTVPGPPGKTCTGSIPHLWRGLFTRNVSSAKAIRGFRPSATGTSEANARQTRLMNTALVAMWF